MSLSILVKFLLTKSVYLFFGDISVDLIKVYKLKVETQVIVCRELTVILTVISKDDTACHEM